MWVCAELQLQVHTIINIVAETPYCKATKPPQHQPPEPQSLYPCPYSRLQLFDYSMGIHASDTGATANVGAPTKWTNQRKSPWPGLPLWGKKKRHPQQPSLTKTPTVLFAIGHPQPWLPRTVTVFGDSELSWWSYMVNMHLQLLIAIINCPLTLTSRWRFFPAKTSP